MEEKTQIEKNIYINHKTSDDDIDYYDEKELEYIEPIGLLQVKNNIEPMGSVARRYL